MARFNFSHDTRENHLKRYQEVCRLREELGLPVAAMLVDETQKIVDFNQEAGSLFSMQKGQEKYIFEIMDPGDVQYVLGTGLAIRGKRIDIPELFLRVEASFMPLKSLGMVLGLFQDPPVDQTAPCRGSSM